MSQPNDLLILGDHPFLNYMFFWQRGLINIPRVLLILTWHYSPEKKKTGTEDHQEGDCTILYHGSSFFSGSKLQWCYLSRGGTARTIGWAHRMVRFRARPSNYTFFNNLLPFVFRDEPFPGNVQWITTLVVQSPYELGCRPCLTRVYSVEIECIPTCSWMNPWISTPCLTHPRYHIAYPIISRHFGWLVAAGLPVFFWKMDTTISSKRFPPSRIVTSQVSHG